MTIEARRIDNNTYDLFLGKGWDHHVRVRKGRSSTYRLSGARVPKAMLHDLHSVLAYNMPITPGQSMEEMLTNINGINQTRN